MAKTKILVIEDENIVAKDIQQSLKKQGYVVVGVASTGEEAFKLIQTKRPDIALVDIMLKGEMDGIEVAKKLRSEYNIPSIFLTAYADESTLNRAKEAEPYGYILKPFKEIDLHTSIEIALYKYSKETDVRKERDMYSSIVGSLAPEGGFFVKSNYRLVKVKNEDVLFIEALKDYVVINTYNEKYTIHSTMKDIFRKLADKNFLRVHRSYIVNVDKIQAIEDSNLVVGESKKLIPIGGSFKDELKSRLCVV